MLFSSAKGLWFTYKSSKWLETKGKITVAKIAERRGKTYWDLEIAYSYDVKGSIITGTNIYPGRGNSFPQVVAVEVLAELRKTSDLKVYYDPYDTSQSCLKPGQIEASLKEELSLLAFFVMATVITLLIVEIK